MTLQEIMDFIGARYTFTINNYPSLDSVTDGERFAFAVKHSLLHMNKSIGKLAGECERYDHDRTMLDRVVLSEATVKMFINTLKLAEELGMTADDLSEAVPEMMKSK